MTNFANLLTYTRRSFVLIFALSASGLAFGQSQLGLTLGVNSTTINSDDFLSTSPSAGFAFGVNALFPLYEKADWLLEFSYETSGFNATGYKDYNNEDVLINSNDKIKISSLDTRFLVNQYIIIPEAAAFHIGAQAGIGTSLLNTFKNDDYPIFEDNAKIKAYYIFGLSGGSENYRLNLRYNIAFGTRI